MVLDFVMQAPAYYLIGRIDLTGSSTGWHRARLIESAFRHLNEWWLGGTDHTRHWMATGVVWSADHTDITNHYLHMGVIGGLPLMILFILVIAQAFRLIGKELRANSAAPGSSQFFLWTVGATLFTHAVTFISVSYFDQSLVFTVLVPRRHWVSRVASSGRCGFTVTEANREGMKAHVRGVHEPVARPAL